MNLPLIRSILPIAFLLLAQTSTASGPTAQLTGTATDDSGYPLIGATVQVIDTPWGTITDDDGRYRLRHLSPGLYTVQTSHIGYQPSRRQVEVGAGRTDSLDFTLASAVHLHPHGGTHLGTHCESHRASHLLPHARPVRCSH